MTMSTMHTIRTWLASTTKDTGYELMLSSSPPLSSTYSIHMHIPEEAFVCCDHQC